MCSTHTENILVPLDSFQVFVQVLRMPSASCEWPRRSGRMSPVESSKIGCAYVDWLVS